MPSAIYEKLGSGQPAFTTATQDGDYTVEYPLGASEPTHLLIRARFKIYRTSYSRPAANTTLTYGSATAYFLDDTDFTDERGGLQSFTRLWATVPASWTEPGGTYAYSFPAFTAATTFGNSFAVTAIAASAAYYVLTTTATGISSADQIYLNLNYVRSAQNYQLTFTTSAVAASSGSSVTVSNILPGQNVFTSVTGTVRKGNRGRGTPTAYSVDSFVVHDYALSSEAAQDTDLPQIPAFSPVSVSLGASGLEVTTLSTGTLPTAANYESMVAAGSFLVALPSERRRYLGNIYERTVRLVRAT